MHNLLGSIPGVAVYVDDIIISAGTDNEHLNRLQCVLQKLLDVGLKVKQDKCMFMKKTVKFLGHILDGPAIEPAMKRLKQKELRVFLGTVGFLQRFIPYIRCHCSGLYELTSSRIKWKWEAEHQKQFDYVKQFVDGQSYSLIDDGRGCKLCSNSKTLDPFLMPSGRSVCEMCCSSKIAEEAAMLPAVII
ncbi:hypothetical protein GJ496_006263 [Pomphorhynchus laevis]|nr:hypothetical protein GJ496_006263 [Pomphorhynchus laevis]